MELISQIGSVSMMGRQPESVGDYKYDRLKFSISNTKSLMTCCEAKVQMLF